MEWACLDRFQQVLASARSSSIEHIDRYLLVTAVLETESRKILEEIVEKNDGKIFDNAGILCIKFNNISDYIKMVICVTTMDTHPESPFDFPKLRESMTKPNILKDGRVILVCPYKY